MSQVLTALTVAGAVYLVWLGIGQLAGPVTTPTPTPNPSLRQGAASLSWLQQTATGLGISGLNPKVFLLFLALLPQFVDDRATWPAAAQTVALGLVHVASCAVVYLLVAVGARRALRTRTAAARVVARFSGSAMVVIGTALVVEQVLR